MLNQTLPFISAFEIVLWMLVEIESHFELFEEFQEIVCFGQPHIEKHTLVRDLGDKASDPVVQEQEILNI